MLIKPGDEHTSWGIKDTLKGGFNLLHDSSDHREDEFGKTSQSTNNWYVKATLKSVMLLLIC